MTRERTAGRGDLLVALVVTLVALGPVLLRRGYILRGDMVFVPDQPWKDAWLGLDGAPPRSVPMDAVVWALSVPLPGDVVQKLFLAMTLLGAGIGAARLVSGLPLAARAASAISFAWNPWVDQRLAIGQWAIVAGYAAMPWVVLAALKLGRRLPGGWPALAVAWGVTGLTGPSSALMAGAVALIVLMTAREWRSLPAAGGLWLLVNLPWLVPALVGPGVEPSTGGQFAGFAARSESSLGLVPSVLSLGGIWKESVVPPIRTEPLVVLLAAMWVVLALIAAAAALRRGTTPGPLGRTGMSALFVVAAGGLALALMPALPGGATGLDAMAESFPPTGLLRDSHRYLAPAALLVAVGAALLVRSVLERAARRGPDSLRGVALLLVVWPVLCLPTLAWGRAGWFEPVDYPSAWYTVRQQIERAGRDSVTVVLPWHGSYRGFEWNDHRAMLDPAPRFLPGVVLVDDRVMLDDRNLTSEQPRLGPITNALAGPDPTDRLVDLGVTHVLVEEQPGTANFVPEGSVVVERGGLMLVRLHARATDAPTYQLGGAARAAVIAGDVVAGGLLVGGLAVMAASRRRWMYALR